MQANLDVIGSTANYVQSITFYRGSPLKARIQDLFNTNVTLMYDKVEEDLKKAFPDEYTVEKGEELVQRALSDFSVTFDGCLSIQRRSPVDWSKMNKTLEEVGGQSNPERSWSRKYKGNLIKILEKIDQIHAISPNNETKIFPKEKKYYSILDVTISWDGYLLVFYRSTDPHGSHRIQYFDFEEKKTKVNGEIYKLIYPGYFLGIGTYVDTRSGDGNLSLFGFRENLGKFAETSQIHEIYKNVKKIECKYSLFFLLRNGLFITHDEKQLRFWDLHKGEVTFSKQFPRNIVQIVEIEEYPQRILIETRGGNINRDTEVFLYVFDLEKRDWMHIPGLTNERWFKDINDHIKMYIEVPKPGQIRISDKYNTWLLEAPEEIPTKEDPAGKAETQLQHQEPEEKTRRLRKRQSTLRVRKRTATFSHEKSAPKGEQGEKRKTIPNNTVDPSGTALYTMPSESTPYLLSALHKLDRATALEDPDVPLDEQKRSDDPLQVESSQTGTTISAIDDQIERLNKEQLDLKLALVRDRAQVDEQIEDIYYRLEVVEAEQKILLKERETQLAHQNVLKRLKENPQTAAFYTTFQITMEQIFISAKAAAGPHVEAAAGKLPERTESAFNLVGYVAKKAGKISSEIGRAIAEATPGINVAAKLIQKGIQAAEEKRQQNKAQYVSELATLMEILSASQKAALALTLCFEKQIMEFPEQLDPTLLDVAKQKLLKENPHTPAQLFAIQLVGWIYSAILEDKDRFTVPLEQSFYECVLTKTINEAAKGMKFTNKNGKIWHLAEVVTRVGIETSAGVRYSSPTTDVTTYGYCRSEAPIADKRGLQVETPSTTLAPEAQAQLAQALEAHTNLTNEINQLKNKQACCSIS